MSTPAYTSSWERFVAPFRLVLPVGMLMYPQVVMIVAIIFRQYLIAQIYIALWLVAFLSPLGTRPAFVSNFASKIVASGVVWNKVRILCDETKLVGGPFLIGLEPHSALPTSLPMLFNTVCKSIPLPLQPCHGLATSAAFWVPFGRHLFHWLDLRPADSKVIASLLKSGSTVCLNPGGIQECLVMEPGTEVAFLKSRLGFVRAAQRSGVPLIAAFVFGQTDTYSYVRPGPPLVSKTWLAWLSRKVGFVPLVMWGYCGTLTPKPAPMTVVLGNPILVEKNENPSKEETQKYLDMFIQDMERIFEAGKADAGYPDMVLKIT